MITTVFCHQHFLFVHSVKHVPNFVIGGKFFSTVKSERKR